MFATLSSPYLSYRDSLEVLTLQKDCLYWVMILTHGHFYNLLVIWRKSAKNRACTIILYKETFDLPTLYNYRLCLKRVSWLIPIVMWASSRSLKGKSKMSVLSISCLSTIRKIPPSPTFNYDMWMCHYWVPKQLGEVQGHWKEKRKFVSGPYLSYGKHWKYLLHAKID